MAQCQMPMGYPMGQVLNICTVPWTNTTSPWDGQWASSTIPWANSPTFVLSHGLIQRPHGMANGPMQQAHGIAHGLHFFNIGTVPWTNTTSPWDGQWGNPTSPWDNSSAFVLSHVPMLDAHGIADGTGLQHLYCPMDQYNCPMGFNKLMG